MADPIEVINVTEDTDPQPDDVSLSQKVGGGAGSTRRVKHQKLVESSPPRAHTHLSPDIIFTENYLYFNNGYTIVAAETGGMIVNFLPTSTTDSVLAGAFVAGVPSTSNPTVVTDEEPVTFSAGDLIQISGSAENDGLYEVDSHASNLLTIRGVGTVPKTEDFVRDDFIANSSDTATIVKVNVAVIRTGTDGKWETAAGDTTPFTFTDINGGWVDDGTVIRLDTITDNVAIGTASIDASAKVQIDSTTRGVLLPRMTTAQIDAISSPAIGLLAIDTDEELLRLNKTSGWCHIPCGVITGQFSHSASQKPSVTTPVSIAFDTDDITLIGIAHSTTVKNEEFKATIQKSFTFMLAPQWERTTSGGIRTIDFFIQKSTDGGTVFTDTANSNVKVKAVSNDSNVIPLMITIQMNKDDIVRFQMRVSTTSDGLGTVFTAAEVGPPTIPATPAQILTIFSGD